MIDRLMSTSIVLVSLSKDMPAYMMYDCHNVCTVVHGNLIQITHVQQTPTPINGLTHVQRHVSIHATPTRLEHPRECARPPCATVPTGEPGPVSDSQPGCPQPHDVVHSPNTCRLKLRNLPPRLTLPAQRTDSGLALLTLGLQPFGNTLHMKDVTAL